MAASFQLQYERQTFNVQRKFLLNPKNSTFTKTAPSEEGVEPAYWHRKLFSSPFEADAFDGWADFDKANAGVDTLQLPLAVDGFPGIRSVSHLCKHALATSDAKGKQAKYNEVSQAMCGLNYSQLVESRKAPIVREFKRLFKQVLLVDPREPRYRGFVYGAEIEAPKQVKQAIFRLAGDGHIYAQFVGGLLATPFAQKTTSTTVRLLVDAHSNGYPYALLALGERMLADANPLAALNCAILAMEGGYREAGAYIGTIRNHLSRHQLVMTRQGYMPVMMDLIHNQLSEEMRELLYKHQPEWCPLTVEQQLDAFARLVAGKGATND